MIPFIAGLDRIFRMHDLQNLGVAVDAALVDADAATATARVTALAAGSITDAAMVISQAKNKLGHTYPPQDARRRPCCVFDADTRI